MKIFSEHPAMVGETYFEHLRMAFSFGSAMVLGGLACLLHGLVPALFVRTGSQTVQQLYNRMVVKRRQKPLAMADSLDFVI